MSGVVCLLRHWYGTGEQARVGDASEGFGVSLVHGGHTKPPQNDGASALARLEAAK